MADGGNGSSRRHTSRLARPMVVAAAAITFVGTVISVVLSPTAIAETYRDDRDYSRAGDIGQAYGAASALLATVALGVVAATLYVQYRQLRSAHHQFLSERREKLRQDTRNLSMLALNNPEYRQCWGPRVSPAHIDEGLFYYCSDIVKLWTDMWEIGELTELRAREYLRAFFDSEVPRLFWAQHGNWHKFETSEDARDEFAELVNQEYLIAIRGGLPARCVEPSTHVTNGTIPSSGESLATLHRLPMMGMPGG